jgi:mRNA-degrading endonuclease RelE of RelBE toxin-antitoxin system
MPYRVEFAARAARDLEILYVGKNVPESPAATRWFSRLEQAVDALEAHPERCPLAPEGRRLKRTLRHLLYGAKPHVYRVIFEIDEERRTVWILHIRHGARRRLKPSDLE